METTINLNVSQQKRCKGSGPKIRFTENTYFEPKKLSVKPGLSKDNKGSVKLYKSLQDVNEVSEVKPYKVTNTKEVSDDQGAPDLKLEDRPIKNLQMVNNIFANPKINPVLESKLPKSFNSTYNPLKSYKEAEQSLNKS